MKTTIEIASRKSLRIAEGVMSRMREEIAKRICLGCKQEIPKGKPVCRGLCGTCSAAFYRHADKEGDLEKELIQKGELLPCQTSGPKPSNDFTKRLRNR